MSDELAEALEIDEQQDQQIVKWSAEISIPGRNFSLAIQSIEEDRDDGFIACLQTEKEMITFTCLLLKSSEFEVTIANSAFNSRVTKLESGKAYLRLSR